MNVEVVAPDELPGRAATHIAALLREAVAERDRATLAVSGGSTPARMFQALADLAVPWDRVHVLQVDERVAPDGDAARNLTRLTTDLLDRLPTAPAGVHPMPVEDLLVDPPTSDVAASYERTIRRLAGAPPVIDVVHLGLGDDGHTASLVPGDPVLEVSDRDVAITDPYQDHRRVTLTYPALLLARHLVWLVTGAAKVEALRSLVAGDASVPAGRLSRAGDTVFVDPPAAGGSPAPR